ncbi:hypothetical protein CVT25_005346 [Psilocybe cyanescens]|uniref:DUF6699 domain-containing protein n=1 Tax=Psilocybe cyanescens TaxID=93625 RepID=A0A409WWZ5_PSICY|nr:hypothetical protein CVT25_005346 [Psilocybe cyanescens]
MAGIRVEVCAERTLHSTPLLPAPTRLLYQTHLSIHTRALTLPSLQLIAVGIPKSRTHTLPHPPRETQPMDSPSQRPRSHRWMAVGRIRPRWPPRVGSSTNVRSTPRKPVGSSSCSCHPKGRGRRQSVPSICAVDYTANGAAAFAFPGVGPSHQYQHQQPRPHAPYAAPGTPSESSVGQPISGGLRRGVAGGASSGGAAKGVVGSEDSPLYTARLRGGAHNSPWTPHAQGDLYDENNLPKWPRDWRPDYNDGRDGWVGAESIESAQPHRPPPARDAPAHPFMRLVHPKLPWYVEVVESKRNGVLADDVLEQVVRQLHVGVSGKHYWNDVLGAEERREIARVIEERVRAYGEREGLA